MRAKVDSKCHVSFVSLGLRRIARLLKCYRIGPGVGVGVGVGAGVGVDQEPGVGVGVGTAPPRLRTPGLSVINYVSVILILSFIISLTKYSLNSK